MIARRLPPFLLGNNPELAILYATHTATLSSKINRTIQRIMTSEEYSQLFPDVALNKENVRTVAVQPLRNSDVFEIVEHEGQFRNVGVGQAIAGEGANVLILDDFLRNTKDAESPRILDSQWEWFTGDFMTRQAPGADVIIIATQRSEKDIIGRCIHFAENDPNADQWEVVTFPLICDYEEAQLPQPEYDKREQGEPLWAEKFGIQYIEAQRATMGSHLFSAIAQQRPTAREGNVIKRGWYENVNYYPVDSLASKVVYWDLGASDNPEADRTSGSLKVKDNDGVIYKLWQYSGQWNPNDRNRNIKSFSAACDRLFKGIPIWIEGGIGLGVQGVQDLRNELLAIGLNVRLDPPRLSKYDRASSQKDSYFANSEAGRIQFYTGDALRNDFSLYGTPEGWVNEFHTETGKLQFKQTPNGIKFTGGHDDLLDSDVGAFNKLTKQYEDFEIRII